MARTMKEVFSVPDLQDYLKTRKADRLYHYTTYESLVAILTNRCFRITRLDLLNDRAEQALTGGAAGSNSYILSFANTPREYVSMWAMYGKPSGIKLRVDFPAQAFAKSVADNFYSDSLCRDKMPGEYRVSHVVYYDRKENRLHYNAVTFENLDVTDAVIQELAGFVKYDAWEFEKEIRLRVLPHGVPDGVRAPYIYAGLNDELVKQINVTYNPWISDSLQAELERSVNRLAGTNLSHQRSANHGEIREL